MRTFKFNYLLVASVLLWMGIELHGQQSGSEARAGAHLSVAVSYQSMYSNPVGGGAKFWMQGGSIQLCGQFWHGLGEVVDISGLHSAQISSGVGLDMVTVTFGPRYTWGRPHSRLSIFGEALTGEAFGM